MTTLTAPSVKDQIKSWMRMRGTFRTHDVIAFGLSIGSTRAQRYKGELHAAGAIRAWTKDEKIAHGIKTAEDVYEWVGEPVVEPNGQLSLFATQD